MDGRLLLLLGTAWLAAGYFLYGRFLARFFGIDPALRTPAHRMRDGVDYVPARMPILLGHHFASIAGAGPIVGPVMAAYFGWLPAVLWILFGAVFVGAMHDFAALFISVRNDGRSIGSVIEQYLGPAGKRLFLVFAGVALVLVVAVFALFTAASFVSTPAVATASILFMFMAPVFGWLVYRRGVGLLPASLVFVPLVFGCIGVGYAFPFDLATLFGLGAAEAKIVWVVVLMAYCFLASVLPVWLLLQPRDYLNSYLLYAMIIAGLVAVVGAAPDFHLPALAGLRAEAPDGIRYGLLPVLFVTVACGACSGFHALVASGTTAKQVDSERDIVPVGYGSMLIESVLGLMSVCTVAFMASGDYAEAYRTRGAVALFADGLAGFSGRLGLPAAASEGMRVFIALAIAAFLLTTLDTATRLARFIFEELFFARRIAPGRSAEGADRGWIRYAVTAGVVALALGMALGGSATALWPVFGASNQLLAGLTLLVVTLYLRHAGKSCRVTLWPMLFMLVICFWALVEFLVQQLAQPVRDRPLLAMTGFLLATAVLLTAQALRILFAARKGTVSHGA